MTLEALEQIGKQAAREGLVWGELVPKRYHELVEAVENQELERIRLEEQAEIDEAFNRGWNRGLYDLARKRVTARTLQKRAKKLARGDDTFMGAYVSVVSDALLCEIRQAS